jgi:hypothetical protein
LFIGALTLQSECGMDYAGNTVRNINRARELLRNWPAISRSSAERAEKERNELKNLGFADGTALTPLGRDARRARSHAEVARLWCQWLHDTPDAVVASTNRELLIAKRVFAQFWRLSPDVTEFFLDNAEGARGELREILKTIELLCNATDIALELSLDDIRTLAPLLSDSRRIPISVREAVKYYLENKGTRTWEYPDRRLIPEAWREVSKAN